MDMLLAALLFLFGFSSSEASEPVTLEKIVTAVLAFHEQRQEPPEIVDPETGQLNSAGKVDPDPDAPKIKGLYMTGPTTSVSRFNTLIQLINDTELNAVVLDIKEDKGFITYEPLDPDLRENGNYKKMIPDIHKVMETFAAHDIYPIARIVVFKDTELAHQRPDLSFLRPDGTVWDNGKPKNPESFVNPYMKEVWDYNIKVAKEAASLGFREIQFDYVRFPEGFEHRADELTYTTDERSRVDVVTDFVKYAREELNPLGVRVSVDIFGYAASVPAAEGIGQDFNKISTYVDVISPMVYPSHYSTGWFDQRVPDKAPYETIYGAMMDTHKKLEEIQEVKPIIRPWIQDFTATWLPEFAYYDVEEVEAQIRALYDAGIEEFLLWNSGNVYTNGVNYDLQ